LLFLKVPNTPGLCNGQEIIVVKMVGFNTLRMAPHGRGWRIFAHFCGETVEM